jgi:hypothetical protein
MEENVLRGIISLLQLVSVYALLYNWKRPERRQVAATVLLAQFIFFLVGTQLPDRAYYVFAAVFDLAAMLLLASSVVKVGRFQFHPPGPGTRLAFDMQVVCFGSLVVNGLGYAIYELYAPGWIYDALLVCVLTAQLVRLLLVTEDDGRDHVRYLRDDLDSRLARAWRTIAISRVFESTAANTPQPEASRTDHSAPASANTGSFRARLVR